MDYSNHFVSKSSTLRATERRTQFNNVSKSTHHDETNANSPRYLSELAAIRYIIPLAYIYVQVVVKRTLCAAVDEHRAILHEVLWNIQDLLELIRHDR